MTTHPEPHDDLPTFRSVGINPVYWLISIAGSIIATFAIFYVYVVTQFDADTQARMWEFMARGYSRPVRPDPTPLWSQPFSVQLHVLSVAVAFFVGLIIFLLPKGTGFHRLLGWTFVVAMIGAAATSIMMIADFNTGLNFLHIFTVVTVVSLTLGLRAIRRGNVQGHAYNMIGLYIGGLLVAGSFSFIPGRLMWRMLFGL
jgi:uncharacterized membrane protein